jgi:hypothetical protein
MDLFAPQVAAEKFNPNFAKTLNANAAGVRKVLSAWSDGFIDRDNKFVTEFQTTYNSSFWELYLFAVLRHLGIAIDFSKTAPDFVSSTHALAVEAVIASHAAGDLPEWQRTMADMLKLDARAAHDQTVIRCSNALHNKVVAYRQKYAALPHMKDRPFVISIANYGTSHFHMMGDTAMQRLLFDPTNEKYLKKANGSPVALGVFRTAALAQVSGVLYSSLATFGKARALSDGNENCTFLASRVRNGNETIRLEQKKAEYKESLTDGLRFFSNPHAAVAVDAKLFADPGIKRYITAKNFDVTITCHPDGDLESRNVFHVNSQGQASPPEEEA